MFRILAYVVRYEILCLWLVRYAGLSRRSSKENVNSVNRTFTFFQNLFILIICFQNYYNKIVAIERRIFNFKM